MTLPALIQHHRKTVVETRLKLFYSTMKQVIQMSEIDNGETKYWSEIPTDEAGIKSWNEKYIAPYLKNTQYSYEKNGFANNYAIIFHFNNGSLAVMGIGGFSFYPNARDFIVYEQDSGGTKYNYTDRALGGIKFFHFFFSPQKSFDTYKEFWDGTHEGLLQNCSKTASNSEHAYCTELIKQNGWNIPDDYPFKL